MSTNLEPRQGRKLRQPTTSNAPLQIHDRLRNRRNGAVRRGRIHRRRQVGRTGSRPAVRQVPTAADPQVPRRTEAVDGGGHGMHVQLLPRQLLRVWGGQHLVPQRRRAVPRAGTGHRVVLAGSEAGFRDEAQAGAQWTRPGQQVPRGRDAQVPPGQRAHDPHARSDSVELAALRPQKGRQERRRRRTNQHYVSKGRKQGWN